MIHEEFAAPDESAVCGLAERRVAHREVGAEDVAGLEPHVPYLGRVGIAQADVDAERVREAERRVQPAQKGELRDVPRDPVVDAVVGGADLVVRAHRERQVLRGGGQPVHLDAIGLGFAADEPVEHEGAVHERQIVIVERGQASELGEEAPALHGEAPGQRGGDDCRLLDLHPIGRAVDDGVGPREGIDARREPDLTRTELEVRLVLTTVGEDGVDDEADGGIEL